VRHRAKAIGGDIHVAVFANDGAAVAAQAAALAGVAKVLVVDRAGNDATARRAWRRRSRADPAGGYSHVLAARTTSGKDFLPRVAALLGVPQVSDIMAVDSATHASIARSMPATRS
jgi:electron transfer flavoprotein alpha subunit